jgi:hypothetical protein
MHCNGGVADDDAENSFRDGRRVAKDKGIVGAIDEEDVVVEPAVAPHGIPFR